MMQALVLAILSYATPIVMKAIEDYRASHNGQMPTDDEVISRLHANVQAGNAEWNAWLASHPQG